MAERTAVAAGGSWTAEGTWSPPGVPTGEDDLKIDATCTGTVTVSANAKCRSFDTTGYKGKLKIEKTLSVGGSTVNGSNLAIRLGSETTVETGVSGTISLICSKAAAVQEVFCNGASFAAFKVAMSSATVKLKFGDQFLSLGELELVKGVIEAGASGCKIGSFRSEGELVRELKMGSSTLKVVSNWATSGANLTVTKETSTLEFPGGSARMEDGSSFSYNVVTFSATSAVFGKGSPTIATLNVNSPLSEVRASVTITVTTLATTATSEAKIKIKSETKGTKYAIKATAKQTITGWELEDCEALGGINFIDSGGVDLGGNVNWTFEAAGVTAVAAKMVLTLTTKLAASQTQAVASKAAVTVATKQQTVQKQAVAAKAVVTLAAKAQPSQVQQVAARSILTFGAKAGLSHLQQVAAKAKIVFAVAAKVRAAVERTRKAVLFIFED